MRINRLAIIAATAFASFARADVIDNTWLGGTGSWSDPTKWSAGVVPDNSGSTTFRAFVPSGSIVGTGSITLDRLEVGSAGSIQLVSLATSTGSDVDGTLRIQGGYVTTGPLTGAGTLWVVSPFNGASVRGIGSLEIGEDLTIRLHRYYGAVTTGGTGPLINRGRIIGGDTDWAYSPSVRGAPIQNLGTIEASNGALNIGGSFTRADLGNLAWSNNGTMAIAGTFLNSGQTLNVDAAHPWGMTRGTIVGGTINIANDTRMEFVHEFTDTSYTLDGVTINGGISVRNYALIVKDGLLGGNLDVLLHQRYIASPPRVTTQAATLTIAQSVTVRGVDLGVNVGEGTQSIVNHGTLRAEQNYNGPFSGETLHVLGTSVFNDGTLAVRSLSTLRVAGGFGNVPTALTFGPGGVLDMAGTGTLNVIGQLDLATSGDSLLLSNLSPNFYRIVRTTAGITGQFDIVSPNFEVEYRNGNTELWARFVPEPATAIALVPSAFVMMTRRRTRRDRRRCRSR